MSVRIGVDVGGTFTKAVACDGKTGEVLAASSIPTTHDAPSGVSEGVVAAAETVRHAVNGNGDVAVIAHSTTQAVNALLEGDTETVGVVGLGARPDLRRAAKRTRVGDIRVAPGRDLKTLHEFIDCTQGLSEASAERAVRSLHEAGARSICVSQAFGVEDPGPERMVADVARKLGLPACAGHELSGLYGLEMRTVTGAVNASILPAALTTATFVQDAFSNGSRAALMVMRGDGGAAELSSMRRHPIATAFSGPAASVAGALRKVSLRDGIVVEVGGTSTNISPVRGGRPVLSYVRVLDHVTCVRSLDARVAGIAGGSLVRAGTKRGRLRLEGVGPRSAHIAGLDYASFSGRDLSVARVISIAPRAGDPADYVVLEMPDGSRFAVTPTCAANALSIVPADAYAYSTSDAARSAFVALGRAMGTDWKRAAEQVLRLATSALASIVRETAREFELDTPLLVGVGGGAGALVPSMADELGHAWQIPEHAEVISSIGDALSLVRVEVERTIPKDPSPALMFDLHRDTERQAVEAGASPESVQVVSEPVPERRAIRAVATGSVALRSGALPDEVNATAEEIALAAKSAIGEDGVMLDGTEFYSVFTAPAGKDQRWAVVDLRADIVATGRGDAVCGEPSSVEAELASIVVARTKHIGPVAIAPTVRLIVDAMLIDLGCYSDSARVLQAARTVLDEAQGRVIALISRD